MPFIFISNVNPHPQTQGHTPDAYVHSMFRTGSTYLFNAFRRSEHYHCFYEPLNETVLTLNSEERRQAADRLQPENLGHPSLFRPYFWELYELADEIPKLLCERAIYDEFFSSDSVQERIFPYFDALKYLAHRNGRPALIECCRTWGRAVRLKSFDAQSVHIHLWRNPWDQWWSGKVNPYFDACYELIATSRDSPAWLKRATDMIALPEEQTSSIEEALRFRKSHPLSPENSYFTFYLLWSTSQVELMRACDVEISIDRLALEPPYRSEAQDILRRVGLMDIDFSDCRLALGKYSSSEADFFNGIEARADTILRSIYPDFYPKLVERRTHVRDLQSCDDDEAQRLASLRRTLLSSNREQGMMFADRERLIGDRARLLAELAEQSRNIQDTRGSITWKLSTPLRLLEHWVNRKLLRKLRRD